MARFHDGTDQFAAGEAVLLQGMGFPQVAALPAGEDEQPVWRERHPEQAGGRHGPRRLLLGEGFGVGGAPGGRSRQRQDGAVHGAAVAQLATGHAPRPAPPGPGLPLLPGGRRGHAVCRWLRADPGGPDLLQRAASGIRGEGARASRPERLAAWGV